MARILIGWELGAGRGHMISMLALADALIARGHQVALAVQGVTVVPGALPAGLTLFQAPLWPRLLIGERPPAKRHAATVIDILARLGLDTPGTLTRLLLAWDGILAGFDPQVVIADHAPALLLAAQGRVPTVTVGPGFQVPPADGEPLARLGGGEPGYDEAAMLDLIDADLRDAGRAALPSLSAMLRATCPLIASFAELDPYPRSPDARYIAPSVEWTPPAGVPGEEVFVYANSPLQRSEGFWSALAATGLKVRAYLPLDDDALVAAIARHGVIVERRPVPWPAIAARSRVAVNHGAHGVMCALMLAGIPQLALPQDLEKLLHSEALARAGWGRMLDGNQAKPEAITAALAALHADGAMLARVRAASPDFQARARAPFGMAVADAAAGLL